MSVQEDETISMTPSYQNGDASAGGPDAIRTSDSPNSAETSVDDDQSCCGCCHCRPPLPTMCRTIRRSNIYTIGLAFFLLAYLGLGAIVFSLFESPHERVMIEQVKQVRQQFLQDNVCVSDAELEEFVVHIIEANNRGVSAVKNVSSEPNWSFGQSLFFAGTILTTIGYGHVTPLSEGGKVFCIVYAAIGIPLTLIMFTALVERLMVLTTKLLQALTDSLGHLYRTLHIRLIHLSIILAILLGFIFLIPSAIFCLLEEKWNYLDAFYYCFISMTTIGLGDYIPGDDMNQTHRPLYKICTTFYLFIGLVMMMLTLANIYEVPELNIGYHFYMRSDEDEGERMSLRNNEPVKKYTQQVNKAYQDESLRSDELVGLSSPIATGVIGEVTARMLLVAPPRDDAFALHFRSATDLRQTEVDISELWLSDIPNDLFSCLQRFPTYCFSYLRL
ncbi:hypothetical protein LSH36_89g00039 [Paralvinella palmiformis]|uniref:Potassium channel domain-containing protein n=1 Tax=Paralvinella palmiformis TaxID=53620 RepID=A0AAD9NBX2_9ANNE|nr:hypothetical protein LSH36_89g00039 [Paralvinella palmiformis]